MDLSLLTELQATQPVVVNYANFVTPNFVANGLNALGASPIMTQEATETEDLLRIASALVINLGTINQQHEPLVWALCQSAAKANKPIILDPVAAGATAYRLMTALRLLKEFPIAIIRGNSGEIAALAGVDWQAKGIDAGEGAGDLANIAKTCAEKYHCTVVLSGETDYIATEDNVTLVLNNTTLLPAVVGSGDLLSSIIGAFSGITDNYDEAAQIGCGVLACAGEITSENVGDNATGTFSIRLLDTLSRLTPDKIKKILKTR